MKQKKNYGILHCRRSYVNFIFLRNYDTKKREKQKLKIEFFEKKKMYRNLNKLTENQHTHITETYTYNLTD